MQEVQNMITYYNSGSKEQVVETIYQAVIRTFSGCIAGHEKRAADILVEISQEVRNKVYSRF